MSPEPIPTSIEDGALRRANARHEAALEAGRHPEAVARRIKATARAAKMKPLAYIESLLADKGKLTSPEGTQVTSAFWSYGLEHSEAPPDRYGVHFLQQRFIAEEWAHQQNTINPGSAQTLETTRGGRELDDMFLWEPGVLEALGGEQKGFGRDFAEKSWQKISDTYAQVAQGQVIVFAATADTRSILHRQELGALRNNPNVGLDNIHFVYAPPVEWPDVTRAEAGTNAVRAVAQFDNPALPQYLDPYAYAHDEPEVRRKRIDGLSAVEAPAQEAAAVAAPEVEAPAITEPGVATPEVEASEAEGPGTETPGAEAQAVTPPAVEAPSVTAASAEAPTVEAPAVTEPAVAAPAVAPSAVEAPAAPVVPAAPAAPPPPASVRKPLWQLGFDHTPTAAEPSTPGTAAGPAAGGGAAVAPPVLVPRPLGTGMDGPS
ncbi:hypothetical protein [Streptomyces sp. NPDC058623]|uniref:hypothetical protein n=1 Tax=Streptomyces sp. NPDC058623 TaxID=3346563 RepID=UPI003654C9E7